jgi:hypothetical protein
MLRQGKNGVLLREETRTFDVVADSAFINRLDVLATDNLPKFGNIINGMAVKAMNATRNDDHQLRWEVAITLSSEVEENQNNPDSPSGSGDPTTWTPVARCTFEPYEETIAKDLSSSKKPWLNSAKRSFETARVRTRRVANVPFSQFEPISTKLDQLMDRCDTINATTYKTRDKHQLLLAIEDANIVQINGFRCWRVDYLCKFKKDTWIFKQLDYGAGFYDSTNKYKRFYEEQWELGTYDATKQGETPFMGLLDGSGKALTNQKTGTPVYLDWQEHEEIDFNSFLRVIFTA